MSTGRFFAGLFLALPFAALAQSVTVVDRIVAVVNKEVVTLSQLNEAVGRAERQLRRQSTPAPEREVLQRQMLERLILEKAQLQMARETGIRVDELQLDRAVQRIAENNTMALAEFRRALETDGVSFELWREDLREQILLTRLREREVDDKIQVSETEVNLFLEEMKAAPAERVEYQLAHITTSQPSSEGRFVDAVNTFERALILRALTDCDWNVTGASRHLGMPLIVEAPKK